MRLATTCDVPRKRRPLVWSHAGTAAAWLSFWLLLSPGEGWTWVIIGGYESRTQCEARRAEHLLHPYHLVCARAGR
jgi:hypothetical protein